MFITGIDELFTQEFFSDLTMHHWAWVTNTTIIGVSIFEGGRSKVMNIQIAEDKLELVYVYSCFTLYMI